MSLWRLIRRSLQHYWRMQLAVMLGVAIATAVLTGALIVGDSVRGSLRFLALDRLQDIDFALVGDRYFDTRVVDELLLHPDFVDRFDRAVPVSLLPNVTVQRARRSERATNVLLVGADERFWDLGNTPDDVARPFAMPGEGEIILNEALARALGVGLHQRVTIRLPTANQVPADSPLGHKENRVRSVANLTVVEIIPTVNLGRFRLRTSQQQPLNAYVSLSTVSDALDEYGRVNGLLVSASNDATVVDPSSPDDLRRMLEPSLEDFGITLERIQRSFQPPNGDASDADGNAEPLADFFQFTQDRLVFDDTTAQAIRDGLAGYAFQEILTYLATSIEKSNSAVSNSQQQASIPYSTVSAIDAETAKAILAASTPNVASLPDDGIVLNSWAAESLQANVGDSITVRFFEPETTHDQPRERSASFRVVAIVPLTKPKTPYRRGRPATFAAKPTIANDPEMTPRVEGVTDEESIANWDPPFPFDQSRVREEDDEYWAEHRTTPKAFITLKVGQQLWGSRFGRTTSFRVANTARTNTVGDIRTGVTRELRSTDITFAFSPVKAQALAASTGTTPFQFLFLGFSMFLIASALMLVALLFRLGLEIRAKELGVLRAVGFGLRQLKKESLFEAGVTAVCGAAIGTALGILYAWLMLTGLKTWWLDAIVTPFLNLYVTKTSIIAGFLLGAFSGLIVLWWSLRRLKSVAPRQLLSGSLAEPINSHSTKTRAWLIGLLFVLAIVAGVAGTKLQGEAQAGAFFGCGALVLISALLATIAWLRGIGEQRNSQTRVGLLSLSARAATRRPTRSALTTSLMAAACFLIIAISAFRLSPTESGTGGFDWLIQSGRPIHTDLTDESALTKAMGRDAKLLADATILPLRVQEGDDASCRNLYRPARPRILGVSPAMVAYFDDHTGFSWAATAAATNEEMTNPWRLLGGLSEDNNAIPVVLDKNTAMYSLQLYGGVGQKFTLDYDRVGSLTFQVVGLVGNSILQGNLLVSEADLLRQFPDVTGYQMFLAKTPSNSKEAIARLEATFGDEGLDSQSTTQLLAELMAVQNTYLSTFQSLGALGLLLGVVGLAIAQTRNVLERRGEFALLQAVGFTRGKLGRMVLAENGVLMLLGLGIGVLAALITVLPHMLVGGAQIPWRSLVLSLLAVLAAGVIASLFTVRAASEAPIVAALRGD